MKDIIIREASPEDLSNIAVLKQHVWISTYAVEGIRSEFSNFVLAEFTIEKTIESLNDKRKRSFVALSQNHLIGYIQINFYPQSPMPYSDLVPEIEVLYVLEKFCGRNIGTLLLTQAINALKQRDFNSVWLTVYAENHRAINFYIKNGFKFSGTTHFQLNENNYENLIMRMEINS